MSAAAAGSPSAREALEYACAMLAALGVPYVTPEMLRRAKFNESSPVDFLFLKRIAIISSFTYFIVHSLIIGAHCAAVAAA